MSILIKGMEMPKKGQYKPLFIMGVHGEFYPCKPDIFAKTYEPEEGET